MKHLFALITVFVILVPVSSSFAGLQYHSAAYRQAIPQTQENKSPSMSYKADIIPVGYDYRRKHAYCPAHRIFSRGHYRYSRVAPRCFHKHIRQHETHRRKPGLVHPGHHRR